MSSIRPPDQSVGNPPKRSSVVSDTTTTTSTGFKNKKRLLDVWLGSVIFIASIIEFISWYLPQGDDYLLFWYPVLNTLNFLNLSTFFIVKAFRYNSCVYSKIASISYSALQLISLLAIVIPGATVDWMLRFAYPTIILAIVLSSLIIVVKWILRKSA